MFFFFFNFSVNSIWSSKNFQTFTKVTPKGSEMGADGTL